MSDQEIWNQYYMNKPTDTTDMKPDDMDDDYAPAWEMVLSGLLFAVMVIATVAIVKGCA